MELKTEKEILDYFRHMIKVYMKPENDAFDILPHQVMSHGFMEWNMLLYRTFPSLTYANKEEAFNHFASELFKETDLTKLEMRILREKGWVEYLND